MKKSLALLSLLLLSACGHGIAEQTSIQEVTIETPGARQSVCFLYADGFRHRVNPPQPITISKSDENLRVDCLAPGNRRREVFIAPEMMNKSLYSMTDGDITHTGSSFTGHSLYKYPDRIIVSFEDMPARPEDFPAYHSPELIQPSEQNLEEYLPGVPLLNSDRNYRGQPLRKKVRNVVVVGVEAEDSAPVATETTTSSEQPAAAATESSLQMKEVEAMREVDVMPMPTPTPMPSRGDTPPAAADKGDLMNVLENHGADMDPSGARSKVNP